MAKISLLNLIDTLIGGVLKNSIYSDIDTYKSHINEASSLSLKINSSIGPEGLFPHKVNPNGSPIQPSRDDIYRDIGSNGIPLTTNAHPPTPQLSEFKSDNFLLYRPESQDIANNLYNDGPISIIQGGKYSLFPGPTKFFDIFAIVHWIRNVGSEVLFLPKFTNAKDTNKPGSKGPVSTSYPGGPNGAETLQKSITFLATQFLLAALNKGDTQAYGPLNLVYNPLSILSAFLPARGILPTERPTIGNVFSTYKDNLKASVIASQASSLNPLGERLLLMRGGVYAEYAPVLRLFQLRSPLPVGTGFRGSLNGNTTDTLDEENPLRFVNGSSIDTITDGAQDNLAATRGAHTNIYNKERQYNKENAVLPLDSFEDEFNKEDLKGILAKNELGNIKNKILFDPKPFPGGMPGSGMDLTYVAKPSLQYVTKKGIRAKDLPDIVDVAFSPEDEKSGGIILGTGN